MIDVEALAYTVDDAARSARAIAQFGDALTEADAYAVQAASIARRIARGERRIGMKMGFTSRGKMVQMGVQDMIWGRLTDRMLIEEGAAISLDRYVHPRVEPELAFLLGKPLSGVVTHFEVRAAIAGIAPAMEVIDSRFQNFKFSLSDVIADNASSAGVVIGSWSVPDLDVANLGMLMSFDGQPVQIGSSAAILGHPLRALVAAARLAGAAGESLNPGDIVLAGAATPAEALRPGIHVRLEVEALGTAEFSVRA
jgi:2-oxo-3-hexenedioate decarboxylase